MVRMRWSLVLALAFLAILGWYLLYTEQIVRTFRADVTTMTRMYAEVQAGLQDPEPGGTTAALARLQDIIVESGLPLVLSSQGDTIIGAVNLPFEADLSTPEGQARVQLYIRRLEARNPPVGDPEIARIHYGDPPELQRLRWIPWLQVTGLLLTFLVGVLVVRAQRRAETDQAWTAMARELAHQLGTPISSLQGWLEVLRLPHGERPGELGDPVIAAEIGEDVERLERVSRRFELIGRETPLRSLPLAQVTGAVERYLRARMPRLGPGVALEVRMPSDLPDVQGSEVLLTWALENIVKNALDALAGQGGEIRIEGFHREPEWVILMIEDNGPGIDPVVRDRIFEAGATTKSSGWGVGLALSQRIVERVHGGTLRVARTGPEGTAFELRLPVAAAPAATA
ncbi:MAG: sensor histidine kinase [Gemmatimonadales bacterium]|nr:MAG: sensor histidine kinase [Gemmatimonadales bacterium]